MEICTTLLAFKLVCGGYTLLNSGYYDLIARNAITVQHSNSPKVPLKILENIANKLNTTSLQNEPNGQDFWKEDLTPPADCEDFALTLRKRLLSRGYDGGYLVYATHIATNDKHIILLVATYDGLKIVDITSPFLVQSLNSYIRHAPYKIKKILMKNLKWRTIK